MMNVGPYPKSSYNIGPWQEGLFINTNALIRGVIIYLDSDYSEDTDIGLYEVDGENSQLRWIETDISEYSPDNDYKEGILIPDWLEGVTDSYDGTYGGNKGEVGIGAVNVVSSVIYDSAQRSLYRVLNELGIRLNGKRIDIYEFEIVGGSLSESSGTIAFRGECSNISYDERSMRIEFQTATINRRSNLGTEINTTNYPNAANDIVGEMIPITIGQYIASLDSKSELFSGGMARLSRIANKRTTIGNDYFDDYSRYPELKFFPLSYYSGPVIYDGTVTNNGSGKVRISGTGISYALPGTGVYCKFDSNYTDGEYEILDVDIFNWIDIDLSYNGNTSATAGGLKYYFYIKGNGSNFVFDDPNNIYVRVVDGKGADSPPRKITNLSKHTSNVFSFEIDIYFNDRLAYDNSDESEEELSWIEFIQVNFEYLADIWPCVSFLYNNGDGVIGNPELYAYDDEQELFTRIGDSCYSIDYDVVNNNKLIVDFKHFAGTDLSNVDSYIIIPMDEVKFCDSIDLSSFVHLDETYYNNYNKKANGFYATPNGWFDFIDDVICDSIDDLSDRDSTTFALLKIDALSGNEVKTINFLRVVWFKLPKLTKNITYESFAIGIKARFIWQPSNGFNDFNVNSVIKRFTQMVLTIIDSKDISITSDTNAIVDNLPDNYYDNEPDTNDVNFYSNCEEEYKISGYTTFQIDMSDVDIFNSYDEGIISFKQSKQVGSLTARNQIRIYGLAIILKMTAEIKSYIYTSFKGRRFASTFNSQTIGDLIDTPKLALLHVLMLQNWSESESDKEWGKEYPDTPLIDISENEGGLNHSSLDILDTLKLRRQIFDNNESWTDTIIDSLCNDFFLVSSQNPATGYERISFIGSRYPSAPTTTITLSDIIGRIARVEVQVDKSIFCEPTVKYNYNYATDKYDGLIKITNASKSTYGSSYVLGLSGSSAENAWEKAHKLWEVCGKIQEPPKEMIEKKWIYRNEDALWYLDTWLYYMGAVDTTTGVQYAIRDRLSFDVHYNTGKSYFKGQHINIDLTFHTEDISMECVIESVTRDQEIINVQVMLLDNKTEDDFYIIKSLTSSDEIEKVIPEFGTDEGDWEKII